MALYHLMYSSIPARQLSDAELDSLLELARSANEAHGITGMLICLNDMYVQLIEGEEIEIKQLYKNLLTDTRHYKVQILREGKSDQRFFSDWSMGYEKKELTAEFKDIDIEAVAQRGVRLFSVLDSLKTIANH